MRKISAPLTLFLIGATGDLARRRIWIALFQLYSQELLPEHCTIVGLARAQYSSDEFRSFLKEIIPATKDSKLESFLSTVEYISGDVDSLDTFQNLRQWHDSQDKCGNHLWYVATLPSLYRSIIGNIKSVGFESASCGWTKVLLEKPFGTDLATSQQLNSELLRVFSEDQIYRIDHFLAKETVQNLLIFRFGNGLFENLWNKHFIDHIQITASETYGIGTRGSFYDGVGTVRDVVQNHVLQMLAMTLMEEPKSLEPANIRKSRMEFLEKLEIVSSLNLPSRVLFGQYTTGSVLGEKVKGYLEEEGIPQDSKTETAVVGKIFVNTDRWKGVPIYFRAGKRLAESVTEISIKFKEPANQMFTQMQTPQSGNVLTLRIQPNEGVIVRLNVKKPGLDLTMEEASMQFCYRTQFQMGLVEAYEKLLYDAIQGDTTLFPQAEDIDTSWKVVQPMLDYLVSSEMKPLPYAAGTWGPEEFNDLLEQDGRAWIAPQPDACTI